MGCCSSFHEDLRNENDGNLISDSHRREGVLIKPDECELFSAYFLETEMQDGSFSRRPSEVVVNGPPGTAAPRKWSRNGVFK